MPQLLEGVSPKRQKIKLVLLTASILFLMLALARPQWGFVWEEANQRGRDILIAVDTSRSMLAEDMAPNRLSRAKLAALDAPGKIGGAEVVPTLLNALQDEECSVRVAALEALREVNDPRVIQPVIGALNHQDAMVRAAAAHARR